MSAMKPSPLRRLTINVTKVCRHRRKSFPREVAYILRSKAVNVRTGRRYNFQRRGSVEDSGMVGWAGTLDELMESAVLSESELRKKVVEGRMVVVALPHELDRGERLALVRKCAEYLVRSFNVAVVFAVHPPPAKGDPRNWHAHLLFTSRKVISGASLGPKTRELDDLKTGGKYIEAFRAWWCAAMNQALRHAGFAGDIEHKSYVRLGEKAKPGRHRGERWTAAERRRRARSVTEPEDPSPKPGAIETASAVAAEQTPKPVEPHGQMPGVDAPLDQSVTVTGPSKATVQSELALVGPTMPSDPANAEIPPPEILVRPQLPTPIKPKQTLDPAH
jgi:hypothetical protein